MAITKTHTFALDDSLTVTHDTGLVSPDGTPMITSWTMTTPDQVAKHEAQFRADMSAANKAKFDAVKAKVAPADGK
jgi:hypothetical protein